MGADIGIFVSIPLGGYSETDVDKIPEYGPGSDGTPSIDDVILFELLIAFVHFWPSFGDFAAKKKSIVRTEVILRTNNIHETRISGFSEQWRCSTYIAPADRKQQILLSCLRNQYTVVNETRIMLSFLNNRVIRKTCNMEVKHVQPLQSGLIG